MEIRQFLTDLIGTGGIAKELEASFRAMRAACHKFLKDLGRSTLGCTVGRPAAGTVATAGWTITP
jgi:hypothetical protein